MFAITCGLNHSAVMRLKNSRQRLPPKYTKLLEELTQVIVPDRNFSRYRNLISNASVSHVIMSLFIRCVMVSTDQADSRCFYFRILWILMEWCWFYFFFFLPFSAGPQKQQHKVCHNYRTRAIINRCLYYFYPVFLFHWGLYYRPFMYVLKMKVLHFLSLKSAVYLRERFLIKSGL